ncbi:MAG: hypothetical protein HDQ88_01855 [Clostridia bacterium]|nr:hypothetical protein [Clostridia bacterium]
MSLSFLPEEVKSALNHLNINRLTEIRLRRGQPVVIEYDGSYAYLGGLGFTTNIADALKISEVEPILTSATDGCVYGYTEQMKSGFITVGHGVRIGIAGEYVTENGKVNTIRGVTSLNIRIPHDIKGCADYLVDSLFKDGVKSTLIYSKPGLGKTTMLRDIARNLGKNTLKNVLIFDERGEIGAFDGYGDGFDMGTVDVIRAYSKLGAIVSAIRAMKPDVIITDELYGDEDIKAVQFAVDCSIAVIASSHISDRQILQKMPFEYYAELKGLGVRPDIYDKNFNSYCDSRPDDGARSSVFGK